MSVEKKRNGSSDRGLKVLLLAGRFEVRGSCAYTLRMAEHCRDFGVDCAIVCSDATRVPEEKRRLVPVFEYPYLDHRLVGPVVARLVERDLVEWHPDLIHVQTLGMLACGKRLAADLKRPFVVTIHDYPPALALRLRSPWFRKAIAVSKPLRAELLRRVDVSADDVVVIHSGVECLDRAETGEVLRPGRVPVVGTAGPLESVKGIPYFLEAAALVCQDVDEIQFLVAGAGPEEENLRRLARRLGIQHCVTFAPNFYDFSVSLAAMDIFCLPSLQQGLGTIMLEAMALGKPVIASGVGGVYDVIQDGRTGLVVPPMDSSKLASRILELLNNPVRARLIGQEARRLVLRQFNVNEMVRQTVEVYRQAVQAEVASVA